MLIWAGSTMWNNENVYDFRAIRNIDDRFHLSMIVGRDYDHTSKGEGVIVDQHYLVEKEVQVVNDLDHFNMHEFNVQDGGKTALACTYRSRPINMTDLGHPAEEGRVVSGGFVELDTDTSEILFQWESLGNIALHESKIPHRNALQTRPGWDYVHINAVDKNDLGDYIISLRFTNTIYGISGKNGNIMWRLGGRKSDFDMNFTFSKQHDVKFLSSNGTNHVISFLNNASDERSNDENMSSALFVELDTAAMTARVIQRINRPDHSLTRRRGNVMTLPNNNVFVGWSERGYQSEHAPNGDVLMTARFVSERYSTYRAYKSEFIGRPATPPDVVASVYGTSDEDMVTTIYVSWNGATDVASWDFYARAYDRGESVLVGHASKTDFETMFIVDGYLDWITAKALDVNGKVLGTSRVHRSNTPSDWKAVGFTSATGPSPSDPSDVVSAIKDDNSSASDSFRNGDADTVDDSHTTSDASTNGGNDTDAVKDSLADKVNDGTSTSHVDTDLSHADAKEVAKAVYKAYDFIYGVGGFLLVILLSCTAGGILVGAYHIILHRKLRYYHHISSVEGVNVEDASLPS